MFLFSETLDDTFQWNHIGQINLTQNNLLTTVPRITNEFEVTFELMADSFVSSWQSVIHLTINNDIQQYGDRIPAVFIDQTNRIMIASAVNGEKNYYYVSNVIAVVGTWTKVSICQGQTEGKLMLKFRIDDTVVHSVENGQPSEFENVKVYAADPWRDTLGGKIRGLRINGNSSCHEGNMC